MAGYSGTPLPKKLGIKDGYRVAMVDAPEDVKTGLRDALAGCRAAKEAPLDYIHLFARSRADFQKQLKQWSKTLAPAGMLWVSWPKKSSGVTTDLTEDIIREIGLAAGLVDIKVCAVTDVWSGLKFVIPVKNRPR
jgi:hypothetical protein